VGARPDGAYRIGPARKAAVRLGEVPGRGLTELAGVYPVKSITLPETLDSDAVISATWNAETAAQAWTTGDGDNLELEFTATIDHGRWYSFALSSAPVITVSGRPRSAEDWMRRTYIRSRRSPPWRR
jgi:hypothetical protein